MPPTKPLLVAATLLFACTYPAPGLFADSNPWAFLPTEVLEIEGGTIDFQSALIVDTTEPVHPLLQKHPTKYLLPTTNHSDRPVWIETVWHRPEREPYTLFHKLNARQNGSFFLRIKEKEIDWNRSIPVQVTVYADKKKRTKLGARELILYFDAGKGDKEAFTESAEIVNKPGHKLAVAMGKADQTVPLIPGFLGPRKAPPPVPGSHTDPQLSQDITSVLEKDRAGAYPDCEHSVLFARQVPLEEALEVEVLSEQDRELLNELQIPAELLVEEWWIQSCDRFASYLVLMTRAEDGGTDIRTIFIGEHDEPPASAPSVE